MRVNCRQRQRIIRCCSAPNLHLELDDASLSPFHPVSLRPLPFASPLRLLPSTQPPPPPLLPLPLHPALFSSTVHRPHVPLSSTSLRSSRLLPSPPLPLLRLHLQPPTLHLTVLPSFLPLVPGSSPSPRLLRRRSIRPYRCHLARSC